LKIKQLDNKFSLYDSQMYYCTENCLPLIPKLSQINPIQAVQIYF